MTGQEPKEKTLQELEEELEELIKAEEMIRIKRQAIQKELFSIKSLQLLSEFFLTEKEGGWDSLEARNVYLKHEGK